MAGPVEYFAAFWGERPGAASSDAGSVAERGRLAGASLGPDPVASVERDRDRALKVLEDLLERRDAAAVLAEALTGRGPLSAGFTVL